VKKDYLTVMDLSSEEIMDIIKRAVELKSGKDSTLCPLMGKSIGLIFEKSSTRTRVSFEVGIYQLGGHPVTLKTDDIQMGRGETVADTARTLSQYLSAVAIRTYEQEKLVEFAANASVPVINALSDQHHPCQALADLLTVYEKKGALSGTMMTYIGDGNNVANSLIEIASRTGMKLTMACPEGYGPDEAVLSNALEHASSPISVTSDPEAAAKDSDVLYTDVWVSMGQEEEKQKRMRDFNGYQINASLVKHAKPDAIVMHCLPAYRGLEISEDVLESPQSVVFDQAGNRLHAQKSLLEYLLARAK
jgi:ornithine carbamoyltransferase